ncbi:hypothetical protein HYALB_00004493 [Hymenoscyphus albidus]|uniref:DUF218 domain-containing protein n=1 Tax=Hymenoscyphus albidus TaxID=595503 RepID=A0A9N9QBM9_9HELO|nr:hypothetical protein HYALB_00004493 [Hymenoscyphus albidus]
MSTADINKLARFLAHPQILSLSSQEPVDCIVICASSVLYSASYLFSTLQNTPRLTKYLVLCGGVGHSTPLIYEAVAQHETYHKIKDDVIGLPEARVLEVIMNRFFDVDMIKSAGCEILIEDKSTNCGSNAIEARKLLENSGVPSSGRYVIIQDPTMSLRTIASFQKTYSNLENRPEFLSCPTFIPKVRDLDSGSGFDVENIEAKELWKMNRFVELLVGEIPRLRDDNEGYGPKGKGFIAHVDVPQDVEEAWGTLMGVSRGVR